VAFLGRIPGTDKYSDIKRHPDNELIPGALIFRVESTLVYFNVAFVYRTVLEKIKSYKDDLKVVIFDLSTSATIDSSGARLIKRMHDTLSEKDIDFFVTEAHSVVRDMLRKEKIEKLFGHIKRTDTLHDTIVTAIGEKKPDIKREKKKPKKQHRRDIMAQIVLGNNYFTKTHPQEYFESFDEEQNPYITLVTCSDSRVPLNSLMPDTSNKVFSVRNIGNQILSTEGSVDYGVNHLRTPILFFLGHSDCHAIKAYMKGIDKKKFEDIKHELDFLRPVIIDEKNPKSSDEIITQLVEDNLDYQVNIAYKKYREKVQSDELTIIAGFYDFKGEYGKGKGDIVIVNVNRQKNVKELRKLPIFKLLSKKQKKLHIGRFQGDKKK
jgi:carbonic anhydrase